MRGKTWAYCALSMLAACSAARGTVIYVPDDHPSIQAAIVAAAPYDEIVVRPGTYAENVDFLGKPVAVRSEAGPYLTVIDAGQAGSAAVFQGGEGADSILEGFTITNGIGTDSPEGFCGGGVFCFGSSPTIAGNVIAGNSAAAFGGGICCVESAAAVVGNSVTGNTAFQQGGGIACTESDVLIDGNLIAENTAAVYGGGILSVNNSTGVIKNNRILANSAGTAGGGVICVYSAQPVLANNVVAFNQAPDGGGISCVFFGAPDLAGNTIFGNTAVNGGGGVKCNLFSAATVENTILWGNSAAEGPQIWVGGISSVSIGHSDVEGGQPAVYGPVNWGAGMISSDPLLAGAGAGDFHLTWSSPCRDAGSNGAATEPADFEGDLRIVLGAADIGADEYFYHLYRVGDVVPGGAVDLKVIGYPGAPVTLFLGSGIQDPPYPTQHGDFWLAWPPLWQGSIGSVPGGGILVLPATVPAGWITGEVRPLQALVGSWGGALTRFTNLERLLVE